MNEFRLSGNYDKATYIKYDGYISAYIMFL